MSYTRFLSPDDPRYLDSFNQFAARRGLYASVYDLHSLAGDVWRLCPRESRWDSAESMVAALPGQPFVAALPGYQRGADEAFPRLPLPSEYDAEGRYVPVNVAYPDRLPVGFSFHAWVELVGGVHDMCARLTDSVPTATRVLELAVDLVDLSGVRVDAAGARSFAKHCAGKLGMSEFERLARSYRVGSAYTWNGDVSELGGDDTEPEALDLAGSNFDFR